MESKNATQLSSYLQDCENHEEYQRAIDSVTTLLKKKYNHGLFLSFCQYFVRIGQYLETTEKMKVIDLLSTHINHIQADNSILSVFKQYFSDLLIEVLKMLIQNQTFTVKLIKSFIDLVVSLEITDSEFLPFITALFAPKLLSDCARALLVHICKAIPSHIEKIILVLPELFQISAQHEQFLFDLQKSSPDTVHHILQQVFKIKQFNHFKQLITLFNRQPEVFTNHLITNSQSSSVILRRNTVYVIGEYFPTSQQELDVSSQINCVVQMMMDQFVVVRHQAVQAAGQILIKYHFNTPGIQQVFDQLIMLGFDAENSVRNKALEQIVYLLEEQETKKTILKAIQINIDEFKKLIFASGKTKQLISQIFLMLQQENLVDAQFSKLLMNELNEIKNVKALFTNGLQSFADEPEFCYQQIYIAGEVCPSFLEFCLQTCIDEIGLEVIFLSQIYNQEYSQSKKTQIDEYIAETTSEDHFTMLASLANVLIQVCQKKQFKFLYKFLVQAFNILQMCPFQDCIQFACQGLTKEFQETINKETNIESCRFNNFLIYFITQQKKKVFITQKQCIPQKEFSQQYIDDNIDFADIEEFKLLFLSQRMNFLQEINFITDDELIRELVIHQINEINTQIANALVEVENSGSQVDILCLLIHSLKNRNLEKIHVILEILQFEPEIRSFQLQVLSDMFICLNQYSEQIKQLVSKEKFKQLSELELLCLAKILGEESVYYQKLIEGDNLFLKELLTENE